MENAAMANPRFERPDCYSSNVKNCLREHTGWRVSNTDPNGIPSPALNLREGEGGFRPEYFASLAKLEEAHFWFRARNDLIVWALGKYFPKAVSFLEIGCGTGFVLSGIAEAYPRLALFGIEVYSAGLGFAAGRVPHAQFMQMDARRIPFEEHFDTVGAFDVLEHIEEDEEVLARIRRALKPGGGLLLTVPQHRWLWSPFDSFSCHVRRYSRNDLHEKLSRAGFEIVRSTSFVSLLLPAMFASRFCRKGLEADADPLNQLRFAPRLDRMLEAMLRVENQLINAGISFPFGGSRLIAARRA
jgi:SAM-dependent methyltransferase